MNTKNRLFRNGFYLINFPSRYILQRIFFIFLVTILAQISFAQSAIVTGKVLDDKGLPLTGATVELKGTKVSSTVNETGLYSIEVPGGNSVLVFSFVGYQSREVNRAGKSAINVVLTATDKSLDQVIVTGYSKQSKRDITGAISTISADVVAQTPVTDVGSVLQGRVAGVSVDNQGGPGSAAVVRIRGFGTNGNNDPLYVIDGVQVRLGGDDNTGSGSQNVSNLINPGDIESMTILKDPSITSLYGAEGGNGVIVITTKSGKLGKPKLDYSSYASWETPIKYIKLLSPQDYANTYWGYLTNSGQPLSDLYYGSGTTPVLPDYIIERKTGAPLIAQAGDPAADLGQYDLNSYRILRTNKQGTDWSRAVLGQAFTTNHQLSVSGATDKSNYALSMNYFDNKGILAGTYFKRYSLRVNTEFRPAKWLKLGENISFSFSKGADAGRNHNPQGFFGDLYNRSPLIPMFDLAGNYSGPKGIPDSKALHAGGNNPLFGQLSTLDNGSGYSGGVIGSTYIDIEPIKGLVFESKIGVQFYPYSYHYFTDTVPQNVFSAPYNSFTEGGGWSSDWRWTNKVSYDFRINNIHKFSAFAAYEARRFNTRSSYGTTPRLPYTFPSYRNLSNGVPIDTTGGIFNAVGGGLDEASSVSVFGNVNYSLLDKYLLSFVIRRDGSTKFGPLHKYGVFPSYSAGWRISKESFMQSVHWVNDLKIRAAVGSNGNDAIPSGLYVNQYNTDGYTSRYDINGDNNSSQTGVGLFQLGNPAIHWETNKTTNIGFDATLFNSRFNVAFSWFNRDTKDLLGVPPASGLQGDALPKYENIIRFANKGVELELGYVNNFGDFRYEINANISTYRNKVAYVSADSSAHLDGNSYNPTHFSLTRSVAGRPVSAFFGLVQEGIFQSAEDYTKTNVSHPLLTPETAAGHFKFKDVNKDGKIDDADRTFIGSPHPKFSYGFNLNLYYKNFDISVFIQGVQGNDIFNYWRAYSVWPGAQGEGSQNTWSPTNTGAKLPIWNSSGSTDLTPSSFFIEDGSYLRLKSLQLGYSFPRSNAFSKLRVYVQGFNLFTSTKYSGIDPEISSGSATNAGVDFGGNYPIARKLLVGVNFGL